jgi:hypothetical protein
VPLAPSGEYAISWTRFSLQNSRSSLCCHTTLISTCVALQHAHGQINQTTNFAAA